MAPHRINVLVYAGNGSTVESVRHCLYSLRRLLSPKYAIIPITGDTILKEPWSPSCALLVFPGGADLGYCRTLNGEGNRSIRQYVQRGGAYLGLCAGGYFGSKRCEFEVGDKNLEVVGDRELAFFPGTCRGSAISGFVYHSEKGARALDLAMNNAAFPGETNLGTCVSYYNGGGVFVDAEMFKELGVEVLATYTDTLDVETGKGKAAVVYCSVGAGSAVLCGPHPEFSPANLDNQPDVPQYDILIERLRQGEQNRCIFLKACLVKLGMSVSEEQNVVPSLSQLHLSSTDPSDTSELLFSWKDIISIEDGEEYIKGESDNFLLKRPDSWSLNSLESSLPLVASAMANEKSSEDARSRSSNACVKRVLIHEENHPACKETPYFNHHAYFANLKYYQSISKDEISKFGQHLLYGEVVTSTNTMLEKNIQLLRSLPTGFTATAHVQIAGRGRGSNVWMSPAGSMISTICIRHPIQLQRQAPVVFIQYLAALAAVEGIKSYDAGYEDMPVRLKWPNDIYAQDPNNTSRKDFIKIGGVLVNSSYSGSDYLLVVGLGINTANAAPTTSLNALLSLLPAHRRPAPFTLEKLLARVMTAFEELYNHFVRNGFDRYLEEMYYRHWLHTDQIVTLDAEGGVRARIKGITRDYGMLLAEELGWEDRGTGKIRELQSDSNSFDFFKGLVRKKI
ncbi:MAG: biotin holocarboxylase synthetase [Trizodia sp. TS-e1964]|nr:MAG: biotin holocarboxylase synthetase [Trizodia sp. TS-e1964]